MSRFMDRSSTARNLGAVPVGWLLVASIALAACGGTAAPPSGGAQPSTPRGQSTPGGQVTPVQATPGGQATITGEDVCKLIPDAAWDALGAALKLKLIKVAEQPCTRETDDGLGQVTVGVTPGRDEIKAITSICGGTGVVAIPGLGTEAIWCPGFKVLVVHANGQSVNVQATIFDSVTRTDASVLAALTAFVTMLLPVVPVVQPPTTGAGDNRACALANQQELQAALGEPFDAPIAEEPRPGVIACNYARTTKLGEVVLRIYDIPGHYEGSKAGWTDAVDVAGIGDRAYWVPSAKFMDAVCGGKVIEVQVVFTEEGPDLRPAVETLARVACTRM